MYHLWGGGGSPFRLEKSTGNAIDRQGTKVELMGNSRDILKQLHTDPQYSETKIAVVSKTDEPTWADECLRIIEILPSVTLKKAIHYEEIYKGSKKHHFQNLKKRSGIDFPDMLFFDNESSNIHSVSTLGVVSIYAPDGMTKRIWTEGLEAFARR